MFGLAFFGFVVLMAALWLVLPRAAFVITLAILIQRLGWVDVFGIDHALSGTIAITLMAIFALIGCTLDIFVVRDTLA